MTFIDSIKAVANDPKMHEVHLLLVKVSSDLSSPEFLSSEGKMIMQSLLKATKDLKNCDDKLKLHNYEEIYKTHVYNLCRTTELDKALKEKYPYKNDSLYFDAILKYYLSIHPEIFQAHINTHSKI